MTYSSTARSMQKARSIGEGGSARRVLGPGTRPPTYVNVPTQVAYAPVPDALIVTMLRALGLCWTNRHRHTPPLTTGELARLLDRPRSTLQRHLDLLERELGWLRRERQDGRFILHPCPPYSVHSTPDDLDPSVSGENGESCTSAPAELPGTEFDPVHGTEFDPVHGTEFDPVHEDLEPSPGTSEPSEVAQHCSFAPAKRQGEGRRPSHVAVETQDRGRRSSPGDGRRSVVESLEARQDLIQALADAGIENPARERIALDPTVKADWIPAWQLWAEHPHRANLTNLPGYIVQCLMHRERPPEQYLRLVRLTSAEKSQLERSRWDFAGEVDPDLRAIRSLYIHHFVDRGRR